MTPTKQQWKHQLYTYEYKVACVQKCTYLIYIIWMNFFHARWFCNKMTPMRIFIFRPKITSRSKSIMWKLAFSFFLKECQEWFLLLHLFILDRQNCQEIQYCTEQFIIFAQQEFNGNHAKYTSSLIYDSETVFACNLSFNWCIKIHYEYWKILNPLLIQSTLVFNAFWYECWRIHALMNIEFVTESFG